VPPLAIALMISVFVTIPILAELFYVLSPLWRGEILSGYHLFLVTCADGGHRWRVHGAAGARISPLRIPHVAVDGLCDPGTTGLFAFVVAACFSVWMGVSGDL
jgi:hypothetical protein